MHFLDVFNPLVIEADDVLGTVALRAHLEAHVDLIVTIVSVAEAVVEEQVRISVLAVEEHDLLSTLDCLARLVDQAQVTVVLMVDVPQPLKLILLSWHSFPFGFSGRWLGIKLVNPVTKRITFFTASTHF